MTYKSPYVVGATYVITYIVFSLALFGSLFKPIAYLFFWKFIRIPNELLLTSLTIGAVTALLVYFLLKKNNWMRAYKLLAAIISFSAISIIIAAALSSVVRTQKIAELNPEKTVVNGFIQSLHNTPKEIQFYTHALAMKDQQCYAWSYRELDFYELPESVYRNVVPADWINECNKALSEHGDNE